MTISLNVKKQHNTSIDANKMLLVLAYTTLVNKV